MNITNKIETIITTFTIIIILCSATLLDFVNYKKSFELYTKMTKLNAVLEFTIVTNGYISEDGLNYINNMVEKLK